MYNVKVKLRNNFSQETRLAFLYIYYCFNCKRSDKGLELHHITGRDDNSIENAIPLCLECHSHAGHSQEEENKYKEITKKWLKSQSNL